MLGARLGPYRQAAERRAEVVQAAGEDKLLVDAPEGLRKETGSNRVAVSNTTTRAMVTPPPARTEGLASANESSKSSISEG